MFSKASYEYGYEENVSDKCRHPVKEENFHYTPKEKRKLQCSAASIERCSKVVITLCKNNNWNWIVHIVNMLSYRGPMGKALFATWAIAWCESVGLEVWLVSLSTVFSTCSSVDPTFYSFRRSFFGLNQRCIEHVMIQIQYM